MGYFAQLRGAGADVLQDLVERGAGSDRPELIEDEPHDEYSETDAHDSIACRSDLHRWRENRERRQKEAEPNLHADVAHARTAKHPSGKHRDHGDDEEQRRDGVHVREEERDDNDAYEAADHCPGETVQLLLLHGSGGTQSGAEYGDNPG